MTYDQRPLSGNPPARLPKLASSEREPFVKPASFVLEGGSMFARAYKVGIFRNKPIERQDKIMRGYH